MHAGQMGRYAGRCAVCNCGRGSRWKTGASKFVNPGRRVSTIGHFDVSSYLHTVNTHMCDTCYFELLEASRRSDTIITPPPPAASTITTTLTTTTTTTTPIAPTACVEDDVVDMLLHLAPENFFPHGATTTTTTAPVATTTTTLPPNAPTVTPPRVPLGTLPPRNQTPDEKKRDVHHPQFNTPDADTLRSHFERNNVTRSGIVQESVSPQNPSTRIETTLGQMHCWVLLFSNKQTN